MLKFHDIQPNGILANIVDLELLIFMRNTQRKSKSEYYWSVGGRAWKKEIWIFIWVVHPSITIQEQIYFGIYAKAWFGFGKID